MLCYIILYCDMLYIAITTSVMSILRLLMLLILILVIILILCLVLILIILFYINK